MLVDSERSCVGDRHFEVCSEGSGLGRLTWGF